MPRTKRAPIDYAPQFGAGIFRPKDAVEQDLAELERDDGTTPPAGSPGDGAPSATAGPASGPGSHRSSAKERPTGRTNVRTNERPDERMRVRHSFDIWRDQLLALTTIQTDVFARTGRKPKLGELVQEALDAYIARHGTRTNVRTNERPDE
jgi:hypothetical protein